MRLQQAVVLGGALLLLTFALGRWHAAEVVAPVVLESVERPAAILVLQNGDCPDRRSALAAWIGEAREAWGPDLDLRVAWVGEPPTRPPDHLGGLPALGQDDAARAVRALLRMGTEGTPALLLLDHGGVPFLGETFGLEGAGPRIALLHRILEPLARAATPVEAIAAPRTDRSKEGDQWNP